MSSTDTSDAAADPVSVDPISDLLPDITEWLPAPFQPLAQLVEQFPVLAALLVAAVFYLIALIVRLVLLRNLERVAARTRGDLDEVIIGQLRQPIFTTIFYLGMLLAVKLLRLSYGEDFLINLLASVILVSWMLAVLHISTELLERLEKSHRFPLVEKRTIPLFNLVTKLVIILFGSYVLLMIWGVNPAGWLASAGIVGIVVGLAAKDTLANLFSGIFILADAPYKIGDYINLDSGERGCITAIGMRSTRLLTRDDVEITVPNAVIANAKITNESGGPQENIRIRLKVGVAYGSDVDQVCRILQEIAESNSAVCGDPVPRVRMRAFGASSLDFELLCWIEDPQTRGYVSHELYMAIYKDFNRQGIEIPYSKHDLYIKEIPMSRQQGNPD